MVKNRNEQNWKLIYKVRSGVFYLKMDVLSSKNSKEKGGNVKINYVSDDKECNYRHMKRFKR